MLDIWKDIVPIQDGLHPDYDSAKCTVNRITKAIIKGRSKKLKLEIKLLLL